MEKLDQIAAKILAFKDKMDIQKDWAHFELDFSTDFENRKIITDKIKAEINNYRSTMGLYAIFKNGKCLYIGIGRPIWSRIKSHYYASQKRINPKSTRWIDFFSNNRSKLTIYWTEFKGSENPKQGDKLRQVIENILHEKYQPEFEKIKRRRK